MLRFFPSTVAYGIWGHKRRGLHNTLTHSLTVTVSVTHFSKFEGNDGIDATTAHVT